MTAEEKRLFDLLAKDRSESADTLDKPSMRGVKGSVVEKYSDQAHFIYELLQNADDVGANSVHFVLRQNELLFKHNGTRHFFITDPQNEEFDTEAKRLGDLNAITSVANSNKTESSIGKFGVGFKAVFQYTDIPYIYDPSFCFKIERFIVPVLLENDHPERGNDETLFVFPFNHKTRGPEIAYKEIREKLQTLTYPILFLQNLNELSFEIDVGSGLLCGEYKKTENLSYQFDDIHAQHISLDYAFGEENRNEQMWMFTKKLNVGNICVGYMTDENEKLKPCELPAFCFFPTKYNTGLKFIIHAPFLLTDSREGIKENEQHNLDMVEELSKLGARSLYLLKEIGDIKNQRIIDDSILKIVPLDGGYTYYFNLNGGYTYYHNVSSSMFKNSFYSKMKEALMSGLLPTIDGYTDSDHAYWADTHAIVELFSDEQLSMLIGKKGLHWVFRSISRSSNDRATDISSYINGGIDYKYIDEAKISKDITSDFIEKQSQEWLHKFYKWLSESTNRFETFKTTPIFINADGDAQAAYDRKGEMLLFLPADEGMNCSTVHEELLKNADTKEFIEHIVKLKKPDMQDYIYNNIIPLYEKGKIPNNVDKHFILLFNYYRECKTIDAKHFIKIIKECAFFKYYDTEQNEHFAKASDLYMPTDELKEYFSVLPNTHFLAYDEYMTIVGTASQGDLDAFLHELGVKNLPSIKPIELSYAYAEKRRLIPYRYTRYNGTYENRIDGCLDNIISICDNKNTERSFALWKMLCNIITFYGNVLLLLKGRCEYFYYTDCYDSFDSIDQEYLLKKNWLLDVDGNFVSADNLTEDRMNERYDTASDSAQKLIKFLRIAPPVKVDDRLTDEEKAAIEFANKCKTLGLSMDDLEELALHKEKRNNVSAANSNCSEADIPDSFDSENNTPNTGFAEDNSDQFYDSSQSSVLSEVTSAKRKQVKYNDIKSLDESFEDKETDEDEYTPREIDYAKRRERETKKITKELEKIDRLDELQKKATESDKYSYAWFKSLLEMEALSSNEKNSHSREVNIAFSHVEREDGTQRTLILKHPDRYIPQFLEEMSDIPLVLHFEDQTKTVYIEVSSIKSYTLRVKLKSGMDIDNIDLSTVREATISAQSPAFLLEALMDKFNKLDFDDNFNMQENLCENIEFIFGPPGTGKTTHLARNILIPMMREKKGLRVLVLTPTNKSADVIVNRIMQECSENDKYEDWLVRFGVTSDENIESSVYRDKSFDILRTERSITVTTIARFSYDHFRGRDNKLLFLDEIKWDYIVIDEASMIPLVNIIYPLYKIQPKKFYIAGDPFQIEPITSVGLWKDENIYKLVQLDSFVMPKTVPHEYPVTLLNTQYRSVPSIGTVFSKLTYGGILKHSRTEESAKKLNIGDGFFKLGKLNIIKFPVSRYESIYRSKRLQGSSCYQIYSALFTFEFAVRLAKMIALRCSEQISIGIIAPYRAQADLLDKLIASENMPKSVNIEAGTIHGFQGDECDIIIAVFNAPPSISSSKDIFLNKKNIINVSISRARDYLIMIMPDDDTENVNELRLIKRVERLFYEQGAVEYITADLEDWMFGSTTYLEDNSFTTGHQNVNVYGLPERTYEIRTEDSAVDIQIHKQENIHNMQSEYSDESNSDISENMVTSPLYGRGRIVNHRMIKQGMMIEVVFDDGTRKSFMKDTAFQSGTLRRIAKTE